MLSKQSRPALQRLHLIEIAAFIAGILLFIWLVFQPVPDPILNFAGSMVGENFLLMGILFVLFLFSYLIPGEIGSAIRWIFIICLFGLFLRGYWVIKRTAFFQLYGFQPWVDAAEYYGNSQRILLGIPMQGSTNGRPMFSAFLSILLWMTGQNLMVTIASLTGIVAFVFWFSGEQIRKFAGPIGAAGVVTLTFMFFRNYLGALSSESLGLIFGIPAWIMLYFGVKKSSVVWFGAGMFILTLAFVTRAGPLLVLPLVALAGIYIFRKQAGYLRSTLVSIGSIAAGFILNAGLTSLLSAGKSANFTSYFYSLYGMAAGGKGWGFIKTAAPDVYFGLAEPERTNKIIELTLNLIKENPLTLIKSMLSQYGYFFGNIDTSMFSYLFARTEQFNLILIIILYLLILGGFVLIWRNRKDPVVLLQGAVLLGILLSVPLVPPQDESHMRPYAVVVPVLNLLPFMAFILLASARKIPSFMVEAMKPGMVEKLSKRMVISTAIIAGLALTLPVVFFLSGNPKIESIACSAGDSYFTFNHQEQSAISIIKNGSDSDIKRITIEKVERKMHDIYMSDQLTVLQHIQAGMVMEYGVNSEDGSAAWFLGKPTLYTSGSGWYAGCGSSFIDPRNHLFTAMEILSAYPILVNE